ncbi:unnamed protein product [Gadus morhua 'NCC']
MEHAFIRVGAHGPMNGSGRSTHISPDCFVLLILCFVDPTTLRRDASAGRAHSETQVPAVHPCCPNTETLF